MFKISAGKVNFQELDFMRSKLWVEDATGILTGGVRVLPESVPVVCLFPDAGTRRSRPIHQRVQAPDGVSSGCSYS